MNERYPDEGCRINGEGDLKTRQSTLRGILSVVLILVFGSCSSGNSTGPAAPLPTGQTGSIYLYTPTTSTAAGCYAESGTIACTSTPKGSNAITALATEVANSNLYLLVGDAAGNLNTWTVSNKTTPSAVTGTSTCTALSVSIAGISTFFDGSNSYVYYASQAGALEQSKGTVPCVSSSNTTLPSVSVGASKVIGMATSYNGSTTYIYGITSVGQYFSFQAGTTPTSLSLQALPSGLPSTVNITAITADKYGYLYVTDTANPSGNPGSIYVFYSNNGTLQLIATLNIGNFNDLNNPTAITTYVGNNGSQNYCTTGPCEFIEVANGNGNIMQLIMPVPGFAGSGASISLSEFNAPYANCEVYNTGAMTSFPDATLTGIAGNTVPYVYIGQNGTKTGPCLSVTSSQTFGNSVTAYLSNGE
jgi:hypothetical protein